MGRSRAPLRCDHEAALAARWGGPVAGVDEAGRGPLAGPVVAAAVVLDPETVPEGLDDSKRLSTPRRDALFAALEALAAAGRARIGTGLAEPAEIGALNILRATDLAMARAVTALGAPLAGVLVDGNRVPPGIAPRAEALVGGDGQAASVAAASIIAKVTRDRIMDRLAARHPGYGWERNRGYPTAEHRAAIARLGPCAEHRPGFRLPRPTASHEEVT